MPLPSRDAPPFGLGLKPRHDLVGRIRDRIVRRLALGALERMMASHMNPVRSEIGLPQVRTLNDVYLAATVVLAFTAEPFEYPRTDWPAKVKLVGPGLWEPPAPVPPWLDEVQEPLVLVTCSTLFQNDRPIIEAVCEAFKGEQLGAVVTTADVDPSGIEPPANVRIVRFVPHTPVIERAACVVCHAGMGITQKALAHGVPVVAIPFGRDQPEVARRVDVAGAGVRLPLRKLNTERLRAAIRAAMERRPGAQRVARAFADAGGPASAADALEELVERAGSDRD
jgi:MGT family glycosyltransferase